MKKGFLAVLFVLLSSLPANAQFFGGGSGNANGMIACTLANLPSNPSAGWERYVTNSNNCTSTGGTGVACVYTGSVWSPLTSGSQGPTGPGYGGTSTATVTIGSSGTKTFTSSTSGLAWQSPNAIRASCTTDGTSWIEGTVSSYSSTTLALTASNSNGSGSCSAWAFGPVQGPQGQQGQTGNNGNTVLNGSSAPTNQGNNGDFYINTTNDYIYGPKASGSWPSGVSLVGQTGPTGPAGITSGSSDPGTCTTGQSFFWNTTSGQLELCTATNTYTGLWAPGTDGTYGIGGKKNTSAMSVPSGFDWAFGGIGATPIPYFNDGTTDMRVTRQSGSPATNDCAKFDANGNITTAGAACGSGGSAPSGTGIPYDNNGAWGTTVANPSTAGYPLVSGASATPSYNTHVSFDGTTGAMTTTKGTSQDSILLRGGTSGSETTGVQQLGPVAAPTDTTIFQWPAESAFATGFMYWTLSGHTITPSTVAEGTGVKTAMGNATNGGSGFVTLASSPGTPDGTKFLRDDRTWVTPAGGGNVSTNGTPALHQWGVWYDSTHIKGVAVTASGAACIDSNGEPVNCTNLTDAAIPAASTTTPSMDGSASYGSGTTWARADHVHPSDTSRVAAVTNVKTYMGGYESAIANTTSATTGESCDLSAGSTCFISLYNSGSGQTAMAVALSNAVVGQTYRIAFLGTVSGQASFTPTYTGYTMKWAGGSAPATTAGQVVDFITCYYGGPSTYMYCDVDKNFH